MMRRNPPAAPAEAPVTRIPTPPPPPLPDTDDDPTTDPGRIPFVQPAPVASRADGLVGKVLDNKYRVTELIARGGMGRVYRAEQAPLGRVVALKVLDVDDRESDDDEFRRRFMREAAACARLSHPNTIRIFDYGQTWDDVLYIAMEFVRGRTLHEAIHLEAPMAPARVVAIAKQVASSLREAHGLGLIHRDLKPGNVLLVRHDDEAEHVKVVDFGLVKEMRGGDELTRVDAVVGSPSYMSPEQIRNAAMDQRSDLYSLGVVLYTCLTGRCPFTGANSVAVLMAHLHQDPPPPSDHAPALARCPTLEWVVLTCLAKRPDDRFANTDELLRALRLCERELAGEVVARPRLVKGRLLVPDDARPAAADLTPRPRPSDTSVSLVMSAPRPAPPTGKLPWIAGGLALVGAGGLVVLAVLVWLGLRGVSAPEPVGATPAPVAPPAIEAPGALPVVAPAPEGPPAAVAPARPARASSTAAPRPAATTPTAAPRPAATTPTSAAAPPVAASATSAPVEPTQPAAPPPAAPVTAPVEPAAPAAAPPRKAGGGDLRDPWAQ